LSSSVYILLNKWLYGFEMIDSQCGLKGFEAKTGKLLFSKSKIQKYSIDAEILYLAKKNNIPVEKIPVTIRFQGKSSLNLYIDGIIMIYDLLRIRYIHRN